MVIPRCVTGCCYYLPDFGDDDNFVIKLASSQISNVKIIKLLRLNKISLISNVKIIRLGILDN